MLEEIKKPIFRYQLADMCGISKRTLNRWIKRSDKITQMLKAHRGLIPPSVANEIVKEFDLR